MINEFINWYINDLEVIDQIMFAFIYIPAPFVFLPAIGSIFSRRLAKKLDIDNLIIPILLILCAFMPFFNIFISFVMLDMLGMSVLKFFKNAINLISPSHLKMR